MNPFHTNFKHYFPLAAKDLSISLGSKNPPQYLQILYRDIDLLGTLVIKLYVNAIQNPVHYYQIIKKKLSCRHRGLNPRRTFCAITFQLLFQRYYLSDVRVRLNFCESTVNMPYANGQQISVGNTKSLENSQTVALSCAYQALSLVSTGFSSLGRSQGGHAMSSPFFQPRYSTVLNEKFKRLLPTFSRCAAINYYSVAVPQKCEFAALNFIVLNLMYQALTSA